MHAFSIGGIINEAWEIFKMRPAFLIGTFFGFPILFGMATQLVDLGGSAIASGIGENAFGYGFSLIIALAVYVASFYFNLGMYSFMIKVGDDVNSAKINDWWHPQGIVHYVVATILSALIMLVGFILLIVPGFIALVMLSQVVYIVIDRKLSAVESIKESVRMTKGHGWKIAGMFLALMGMNLVGVLCLVVGLLVTVPVSMIAGVRMYRALERASK